MTSKPAGKRLVKSKSGLKMVCQHDRDSAPWEMSEPPWVPDEEVQTCSSCSSKFDFVRRKHHCRRCGLIFCSKCCSLKVQFHRMGFVDPVRHCLPCATVTKSEEDFFVNYIKLLFSGAPFHVSSTASSPVTSPLSPMASPMSEGSPFGSPTSSSGPGNSKLYHCKLSSDQRSLFFDPFETGSESGSLKSGSDESRIGIQPVDISKVQFIEMCSTDDDEKDLGSGLILHIKNPGCEELMSLQLMSPPEPSRKPSVLFVTALQKGLNMAIESRKSSHLELHEAIEAVETS